MPMNNKFNLFWHNGYLGFRHRRDAWLKPLCSLLIKWKINASQVTGFRLFLAFSMPILLGWNYWIVVLLMAANLILDGVDGGIARMQGKTSVKGKVYDLVVDNATFLLFGLGLIFWNLVDGFWAAFYLINYLIVIFFNLQYHDLKKDGALMSKSRYVLLLAFLLLAVSGVNWFDYACVFCGMYLFIHNIFLIHLYISEL